MTIKFKPAKREGTHVLFGIAGPSRSGKTLSALLISRGLVGDDKRIFVVDTEGGRALHYACKEGEEPGPLRFKFQHGELHAPFSPEAYTEALKAAVDAGAQVVIVDSASHEHEGPGGILEMHAQEHERMGNREATKFAAWIKPKARHNQYINTLLQLPVHLLFCFRAKDKMKMVKNEKGKMEPVNIGWTAICPDRMEYEMADLLLLEPGASGVPSLELSNLFGGHRPFFPPGEPLGEEVGRKLAEWAAGGASDAPKDWEPNPDTFAYFEDLLCRDLNPGEIKDIGKEIAERVGEMTDSQVDEIRALYKRVREAT